MHVREEVQVICARVVSNNDPRDVEIDGVMLHSIETVYRDRTSGCIVLKGLDAALDKVTLTAPFGRTIEIYH